RDGLGDSRAMREDVDKVDVVVVDAHVARGDDAVVDVGVISDVVDHVETKHRFGAGWAGATPRRSRRGLGGPAPKNRGSLPPILRTSRGPRGSRDESYASDSEDFLGTAWKAGGPRKRNTCCK